MRNTKEIVNIYKALSTLVKHQDKLGKLIKEEKIDAIYTRKVIRGESEDNPGNR